MNARDKPFLEGVALLLLVGLFAAAPARADDPAPQAAAQQSLFERIDAAFGDYFVNPLASFMFFDVWFWDNMLAPAGSKGVVVDGEEVVGFTEDLGFALLKRFEAPAIALEPVVDTPLTRRVGQVTVEVAGQAPDLVATVVAEPIDIGALPQTPLAQWRGAPFEPRQAPMDADNPLVVVDARELAPFPLLVELREGTAMTMAHRVPASAVLPPPEPGALVRFNGERAHLVAIEGETARLTSSEPRYVAELRNPNQLALPFIVLWLVLGALFFTVRMGFVNLRAFGHAIEVVRGKYDDPNDPGEISHFEALSSALSATVGLGNIAGVAVAVGMGGPGAVFWMIIAGFLGMSAKFVECTLGQMYRQTDALGHLSGGPMRYLEEGLKELKLGSLGKVLAVLFSVMCIGGSFGGGNMFQANQAWAAVRESVHQVSGASIAGYDWLFGLVLAAFVGLVIVGGIKRIGAAASLIVPFMCGIYVLAGLWVLIVNYGEVPAAFVHILGEAFTPEAGYGGAVGVLMIGFQRAAFSNEAGVGSASIAHSAAATDEPVREGIVALLEPFVDTIVVCTMTGLVVVVTGAYKTGGEGIVMTQTAFGSAISWFPIVLSVAVLLFAFSTMISWSYYGERCFTNLFGAGTSLVYRVIFLFFVFAGAVFQLNNVLTFSDLMILGMAFPNVLGAVLLSGKVKERLDVYWKSYKSGEMRPDR
jgi:alanine or glycine:cation symporter, AGCS family